MKITASRAIVWCALLPLLHASMAAAEEAVEQPAAPPAAATVSYVIEDVKVTAAAAEEAIEGTMNLKVRHIADGRTWVPLFDGNVGVVSAQATGGGWLGSRPILMRRDETVGLLLSSKGEHTASIEFAAPISRDRRVSRTALPVVPALTGLYSLRLDGANLDVSLQPEVPYQTETVGDSTVVTVYGTLGRELHVRWQPAPEMREVETIAFAEQSMLLDISPGLMTVDSTIEYTVLQGKMASAVLQLPADFSVLKVEGDNLRSWDIAGEEEQPRELKFELIDPEAERFSVRMLLERNLGPIPLELEAPRIVAQGVMRQKGFIGIALNRGLQAELVARENVSQVDLPEMPHAYAEVPGRVSLALRYLALPFRAAFRVSTIEPKVYAQVTCLTAASLQRFRQYWDVQYEIRNAGLFQLKMRLGSGMKLISLRGEGINNQSLDAETGILTVDLRSKAEGDYRLSLQTHSDVQDARAAHVPALELLGVERQWGTVAVSADAGVAVEPARLSGISQVDLNELEGMPAMQGMIEKQRVTAPLLAFRYLNFPYQLALTVSDVRPELKVGPLHAVRITRKNLRYESVFDYRIKKAGVFQVRLHVPPELRPSLVVRGAKVEDYSYDAASAVLTVQLTEKVTDELRLELETEALLQKELPAAGQSDVFSVPAIYALDCEQERGYLAVGTDESIRLKRAGTGGGLHDVDVQEIAPTLLQRTADPRLAFRIIESPWQLNLEVTSISPKILARTFNYIRFGEDYLIGTSTIEFTIQYAGVKEFFVLLPEGIAKPNIRGENIKIQEKVAPEAEAGESYSLIEKLLGGSEERELTGELWRVELQSEVKGKYELLLEYTTDLDPEETRRDFSGPRVVGVMQQVEREVGYLAVTGDPSLELIPVEDELSNLTPIDEEEIPVKFRQLPQSVAQQIGRETVPILFAFRYLTHPYRLALSSLRHKEADVVTAVIEACKLDTTLTREGNRITSLVATVRSRYQPFLQIQLPQQTKLWSALVNGRRVRPMTEQTPQGDVTKIPIAQVQGVRGPVKVELQWEDLSGSRLGRSEVVDLRMPSFMGVRVLRLGWVLQLPRGYRVLSARGTLEWLPRYRDFEPAIGELEPTARPARGTEGRAVSGREQFETAQMSSNVAVLRGRGTAGPSRTGPVLTGVKPQLPEQFYFQGLILNPARPAEVSAVCAAAPVLRIALGLVVLVCFGLSVLLWVKSGLPRGRSFVILVALALLAAAVKVIAEQSYAPFLIAVIYTVAGSAVLLGLMALVERGRERFRAAKE